MELADGTLYWYPPTVNTIANIVSGRYTVIVRDNDTGCQDSLVMDLPYANEHTFVNVTTMDNTNCTVFDGAFTTEILPDPDIVTLIAGMGGTASQEWYRINVYQNGVRVATTPGAAPPAPRQHYHYWFGAWRLYSYCC